MRALQEIGAGVIFAAEESGGGNALEVLGLEWRELIGCGEPRIGICPCQLVECLPTSIQVCSAQVFAGSE